MNGLPPVEELPLATSSSARACDPCRRLKRKCDGACPCLTCSKAGRSASDCTYISARGAGAKRAKTEPGTPTTTLSRRMSYFTRMPADSQSLEKLWQGPSSSLNFFDLVQASITGPGVFFPDLSNGRVAKPDPLTSLSEEQLYTLPPDSDRMMNDFFDLPHSLVPVFHRPTFMAEYEAMKQDLHSGIRPKPLFLAYVNLAMTIGRMRLNIPLFPADVEGTLMYQRALNLMNIDATTHGAPSLMLINCLVMVAVYQTFVSPLIEMGEAHALSRAATYAISLGLHVEPIPGQYDPITAEQRRRTFWVTRNIAVHFGTISGTTTVISTVVPTVRWPSDFPDQPGHISTKALQAFCGLMLISSDIILQLYNSSAEHRSTFQELRVVLDLEERLQQWRDALPPEMALQTARREVIPQQLRVRYFFMRLMLMRPSLVRLLTSQPLRSMPVGDRLDSITWHAAERLCVDAAAELIDAASWFIEDSAERGLNLFKTDYVFIAMTVFLAARWQQPFPAFAVYWQKASDLLQDRLPLALERLNMLADHLEQKASTAHAEPAQEDLLGDLLNTIWAGDPSSLPGVMRSQTW